MYLREALRPHHRSGSILKKIHINENRYPDERLLYFGLAPWDVPVTPSASVDESSGCFPESRPERLCVGTV